MKKKVVVYTLALRLSLLALAGCDGKKKAPAGAKKLNAQFIPISNDSSMEAKAKPFAKYLSEKLGYKVNVVLTTDYSTIVEAMASGKVDIEIIPPTTYVQARDQKATQAIPTLQLGTYSHGTGLSEEGKLSGTSKEEVLVRANSNLQTLEDLKSKGIATLSLNSASGYIYPIAEMKDPGIDPTKDYTFTTVNNIPSEIAAVLDGQQDVYFVFEGTRNVFTLKFSDHNLLKDLRVLYLTEGDIPNGAIAVQADVGPELEEKAEEVSPNIKDDEADQKAMSLWDHKGYEKANGPVYDAVKGYTAKTAE